MADLELGAAARHAVRASDGGMVGMRRAAHQALGAYFARTFLRLGDGGVSSSPRAAGEGRSFMAAAA